MLLKPRRATMIRIRLSALDITSSPSAQERSKIQKLSAELSRCPACGRKQALVTSDSNVACRFLRFGCRYTTTKET